MESLGSTLSFAYCIPFAGMLLSIAICPLVMAHGGKNLKVLQFYSGLYSFWFLLQSETEPEQH